MGLIFTDWLSGGFGRGDLSESSPITLHPDLGDATPSALVPPESSRPPSEIQRAEQDLPVFDKLLFSIWIIIILLSSRRRKLNSEKHSTKEKKEKRLMHGKVQIAKMTWKTVLGTYVRRRTRWNSDGREASGHKCSWIRMISFDNHVIWARAN